VTKPAQIGEIKINLFAAFTRAATKLALIWPPNHESVTKWTAASETPFHLERQKRSDSGGLNDWNANRTVSSMT
jgi:hypothetical protein